MTGRTGDPLRFHLHQQQRSPAAPVPRGLLSGPPAGPAHGLRAPAAEAPAAAAAAAAAAPVPILNGPPGPGTAPAAAVPAPRPVAARRRKAEHERLKPYLTPGVKD